MTLDLFRCGTAPDSRALIVSMPGGSLLHPANWPPDIPMCPTPICLRVFSVLEALSGPEAFSSGHPGISRCRELRPQTLPIILPNSSTLGNRKMILMVYNRGKEGGGRGSGCLVTRGGA
jgi:hypothetical protein